jgi:hypothetical protein
MNLQWLSYISIKISVMNYRDTCNNPQTRPSLLPQTAPKPGTPNTMSPFCSHFATSLPIRIFPPIRRPVEQLPRCTLLEVCCDRDHLAPLHFHQLRGQAFVRIVHLGLFGVLFFSLFVAPLLFKLADVVRHAVRRAARDIQTAAIGFGETFAARSTSSNYSDTRNNP